jgi:subtilisin family serine protease
MVTGRTWRGSWRVAGSARERTGGWRSLNGAAAPQARFTGVAPAAHIVDLRALNSNGAGTDSTVIQAIDRAIQLRTQYNIRVINLSLGLAGAGVVSARSVVPGGGAGVAGRDCGGGGGGEPGSAVRGDGPEREAI